MHSTPDQNLRLFDSSLSNFLSTTNQLYELHLPEAMIQEQYCGLVYGLYDNETSNFIIFDTAMRLTNEAYLMPLGFLSLDGQEADDISVQKHRLALGIQESSPFFKGIWKMTSDSERSTFPQAVIHATFGDQKLVIKPYSLEEGFSRNKNLVNNKCLTESSVLIAGLGSVGSLAALQLAKAGVANFTLIDFDTFKFHNLSRHILSIRDVGRYKVSAVRDRILQINPHAHVTIHRKTIEELSLTLIDAALKDKNALIIGAADMRGADVYLNKLARFYQIPFVSIGFWERASTLELFYDDPNAHNSICYECALGSGLTQQKPFARQLYTHEEDLEKIIFEPGLGAAIDHGTSVGTLLVIDLLHRNEPNYISRVKDDFKQLTLIANTNKIELGGPMAELFSYPMQVTTSIEVVASAECLICQKPKG